MIMRPSLIAVLLLNANHGSAIPLEDEVVAKGRFTLHQEEVQRQQPWNPRIAMRQDYARYGSPLPKEWATPIEMEASIRAQEPGYTSVEAIPASVEKVFITKVQIGKQNLTMAIDTGSSDFWVTSTLLPPAQRGNRPVGRIYDPIKSGAKELTGHTWKMQYGDQSTAGGKVYLDRVQIGNLVVPNQAIEAASTISAQYIFDTSRDGLLGFGFSYFNAVQPKKQLTWFDNVRPQLAQPVLTANLKRRRPGTYDIGFIDRKKYVGNIIWVDVKNTHNRGWWDFEVNGVQFGDEPVQNVKINAVVDTGASMFHLPQPLADGYYRQVKGAAYNNFYGGWVYPCANKTPDITIMFSGQKITIPGIVVNYQIVPNTNGGSCFGGIQRDFNLPIPISLFGDVFMKGHLVIFESPMNGRARLGFAKSSTGP